MVKRILMGLLWMFASWCDQPSLEINKHQHHPALTVVKAAATELVDRSKYLVVVFDKALSFESHFDATVKKVQQ